MSKLTVQCIYGKNFNSYQNFRLPIIPGKYLVSGPNGVGKSSLFESVPWTGYKKTTRDRDPSRNGAGDCHTGMIFTKNNTKYEIVRYHKDSARANTVDILVNDELITHRKTTTNDQEVESIIGISYDTFVSSVVVIQGLPVNFSVLTPSVRKIILEDMLQFIVWDSYRDTFKEAYAKLNSAGTEVVHSHSVANSKMVALNSKIQTISETSIVDHSKELSDLADKLIAVNEVLVTLRREEKQCKSSSVLAGKLAELNSSLAVSVHKVESLDKVISEGTCYQCGQKYPEGDLEKAAAESSLHLANIIKLKEEIRVLTGAISVVNQLRDRILQEDQIRLSVDSEIKRLKSKSLQVVTDVAKLKEELDGYVVVVNVLQEEVNRTQVSMSNVKYFDEVLLPSSKFRGKVLEKYLRHINSIIQYICPMLFTGLQLNLIIDGKGGVDFDILVKGRPTGYKSLSGGERRRLDLIIILAFQKFRLEFSGVNTNLLVLDEVFDALDRTGVEAVVNCLDSLFPDTSSVYVITHNDTIKSMFSSHIEITKDENGVSQLLGYKNS